MLVIPVSCLKTTVFFGNWFCFRRQINLCSHFCWLQRLKLISILRKIACFLLYRDFAMDRISSFKNYDHICKLPTLNLWNLFSTYHFVIKPHANRSKNIFSLILRRSVISLWLYKPTFQCCSHC
jgi:hypothetical protein